MYHSEITHLPFVDWYGPHGQGALQPIQRCLFRRQSTKVSFHRCSNVQMWGHCTDRRAYSRKHHWISNALQCGYHRAHMPQSSQCNPEHCQHDSIHPKIPENSRGLTYLSVAFTSTPRSRPTLSLPFPFVAPSVKFSIDLPSSFFVVANLSWDNLEPISSSSKLLWCFNNAVLSRNAKIWWILKISQSNEAIIQDKINTNF